MALRRASGHEPKALKPMEIEKAVKLGAEVFSEAFVFAVAGSLLTIELVRKSSEDKQKELEKQRELAQKEQVRALSSYVNELTLACLYT